MTKVLMAPHLDLIPNTNENGIARVIEAYFEHLPKYGIELVPPDHASDITAAHVGEAPGADVGHCHGLYWTADYDAAAWEWRVNAVVIDAIRRARIVTVPSNWVAESFRRDMHLNPVVIPHGIDLKEWGTPVPHEGFALWNKNRVGDVCNPAPALHLARQFNNIPFVMTFSGGNHPGNVEETGLVPHRDMREIVKAAAVYLSTTKETFGIGTLEAMASGVPTLGYAHGGNMDLVIHQETGYLAAPNDLQDLVEGFQFVMANRSRLGAAAREHAQSFGWEIPVEKVAQVYEWAAADKASPATAAIIIPTYNYAIKVGRAIESALNQEYDHLVDIIVVDDGSDDHGATEKVVTEWAARDGRVLYIRQDNGGVATARNRGIAETGARYITCLDADDAIEPGFLKACIHELENNLELGIAYTKLRWIKPDGSEGISDWPGQYDFNNQLVKQNQVPTCCVFRRSMWERLGGYRSRYAPKGAGSEDAEFWLRAGAAGFGGRLATTAPLFVYSWQSGQVSGDPKYQEPDWLAWHPWVRDFKHPFASLASPRTHSHPVRQYDEPVISVVIPMGPNHENLIINALDSLEAQTYRKWEAIVVNDTGVETDELARLKTMYPFIRWVVTPGSKGPGYARNRGVEFARAPFVMFLDADDWLYPDAMEKVLAGYAYQEGIIYFDYVGKADVSDPAKLAPDLQERVYQHEDGVAILGHRSLDYDPEKAQIQPVGGENYPYIWTNVTCLVPRIWHDEIQGFDEQMDSWEDVDYHWRMARAGKCYVRVPEELLVYRFQTGSRRDAGLQDHASLIEYLQAKYEGIKTVGCNCGGGMVYNHTNGSAVTATAAQSRQMGVSMADSDYVKVRYMSPNRGQHAVVGPKSKKKYGRRAGGQIFLMLKIDADSAPHLYQQIGDLPAVAQATPTPAPPSPIAPPPIASPPATDSPPSEVEFNLTRLPGVTKGIATAMEDAGVKNAQDIMTLGEDGLQSIPGIGPVTAEKIYGAVVRLAQVAEQE